jgi:hypothetical protein
MVPGVGSVAVNVRNNRYTCTVSASARTLANVGIGSVAVTGRWESTVSGYSPTVAAGTTNTNGIVTLKLNNLPRGYTSCRFVLTDLSRTGYKLAPTPTLPLTTTSLLFAAVRTDPANTPGNGNGNGNGIGNGNGNGNGVGRGL